MASSIISIADARLSRDYAGPGDPAFRRDTLSELVLDLRMQSAFMFGYGDIGEVFNALRLHPASRPPEAAARAMAVLESASQRTKELQAIAKWLGRDKESLRLAGQTPAAAIEQAFEEQFRAVEARRKKGEIWEGAAPCTQAGLRARQYTNLERWARGDAGTLLALPCRPALLSVATQR